MSGLPSLTWAPAAVLPGWGVEPESGYQRRNAIPRYGNSEDVKPLLWIKDVAGIKGGKEASEGDSMDRPGGAQMGWGGWLVIPLRFLNIRPRDPTASPRAGGSRRLGGDFCEVSGQPCPSGMGLGGGAQPQHGHLWLLSYRKGLSQGLGCGNPVGPLQTPGHPSLSFVFVYFNLCKRDRLYGVLLKIKSDKVFLPMSFMN